MKSYVGFRKIISAHIWFVLRSFLFPLISLFYQLLTEIFNARFLGDSTHVKGRSGAISGIDGLRGENTQFLLVLSALFAKWHYACLA